MPGLEFSKTDQHIIEKLAELASQFENIQAQMNDPAISCNHAEITRLSREHGRLKKLADFHYCYENLKSQWHDALEMQNDTDSDSETRQMATEELETLGEQIKDTIKTATEKLVMADDSNIDSVIIEIRAGTGGDEAALFAGDLYGMYSRYCEGKHWKIEQMAFSPASMGGFKEIIFSVKGNGVWQALGYEGGGHRVQRVPETESQGRIHTSAATIAVLPEPEELDIEIKKEDVLEHVARSSGPGGQSVNKLNSAIKLEHVPTGITVSMQDEKSQHKNRAKAWRILRSRIYDMHEQKKHAERSETRKNMIGSGDRSQRVRTYNFPQNRVTDHRINLSLYTLDKVIMGNMDELIKGLT